MGYLTGPVNSLADYQVEFNGLLMGQGTNFHLPPDGTWAWLDLAALKTMDQSRTWADGSWSGPDFADVLLPATSIQFWADDTASFVAAVNTFRDKLTVQEAAAPLWVKLPGMPAMGIPAKTNKRALPMEKTWPAFAEGSIQWRCPDPSWQSIPRTLNLVASATAVAGMVFPLFAPAAGTYAPPNAGMDFGSAGTSGFSGTLTNAGNAPAWPYVVVTGPAPSFTITIDGNPVTYSQAIPAGQSVVVDYKTGLATLTGGVDRTQQLSSRMFSPVAPKSTSSVVFTAASGTAALIIADMWR